MHAKASVDGTVIAETDTYELVEGNVYFPPGAIKDASTVLAPSTHTSHCPWKGDSAYYDLHVHGHTLRNAAWYYPDPMEKALHIKDYVAFYPNMVKVEKSDDEHHSEHHDGGLKDKVKHMFHKS